MPLEEEKAEKFFREFWQRKPLLMRNAIPNFICPLDTDELAGLRVHPCLDVLPERRVLYELVRAA